MAQSEPCRFFLQGRCRYNGTCRNMHAAPPGPLCRRDQVPCRFFLTGTCIKGKKCPYRHEELLQTPPASLFPAPPSSSAWALAGSDGDETVVRVYRGALVHFGDGASVFSLRLGSEDSAVRLDGLAPTTTNADVISLLEELVDDVEVNGLHVVESPESHTCSAYISGPDPYFPELLSASLFEVGISSLKAVPVPPRLPSWASTRRVRCNKLRLDWSAPRIKSELSFSKDTAAKSVIVKFNQGEYKIGNTPVEAKKHKVPSTNGVILSELPYNCDEGAIRAAITDDSDSPQCVLMLGKPTWDKDEAVTSIKNFITRVGPVDLMSEPCERNVTDWTVVASFENDFDALEAACRIRVKMHTLLEDIILGEINLEAQLLYSATFEVSNDVFRYIRTHLEDGLKKLNAPKLRVTQQDVSTMLSIDSPYAHTIAEYADLIEKIAAGEVLQSPHGTGPLWIPQLTQQGPASDALKEISRTRGVLLLPNRKREIRYFGDPNRSAVIRDYVFRSLTRLKPSTHTIDLDAGSFYWLSKTGLGILEIGLEGGALLLNDTSEPKTLVVKGTEEEYRRVLSRINSKRTAFGKTDTECMGDCCVCFTPPASHETVVLRCGHTYCKGCFEALCKNVKTARDRDLSVICIGDEARCKNAINLDEIDANLEKSAFEQLLESSFDAYISRRPHEFRYCPTPECGCIYRPYIRRFREPSYLCPKCVCRICQFCRAIHEGQDCAVYAADQAFEAFKRENQDTVKDCPRCRTTVEKVDGCNHIICGGCGIHLCWVCLGQFYSGESCYRHMWANHGGLGLQPADDEDDWYLDDVDGELDDELDDDAFSDDEGQYAQAQYEDEYEAFIAEL